MSATKRPALGSAPKQRRLRRWAWCATLCGFLLLAAGGTGCGQSKYHYVSNSKEGSFFRLPAAWSTVDDLKAAADQRLASLPSGITPVWQISFAGSDAPRSEVDATSAVLGTAQVLRLSGAYRELFSISAIRASNFTGIDPIYARDDVTAKVEVVSNVPLVEGRLAGSRVVANINTAEELSPPKWETIDNSLLFDDTPGAGRIFSLTMRCASECYKINRSTVDAIASSWKVKT